MYDKDEIDRLSERYKETKSNLVFKELLVGELTNLINYQIHKHYRRLGVDCDDMRQHALVTLWENRECLSHSKTRSYFRYFYQRIRNILKRYSDKLRMERKYAE